MIAADAEALLRDLDRLQELRQDIRREEDLNERRRRIAVEAEKFAAPQAFLDLAAKDGIPVPLADTQRAEKVAAALEGLMARTGGDPAKVLGNALDDALTNVKALAQATRVRAQSAWHDHAQDAYWREQSTLMNLLDVNDTETRFGRIVRQLRPLAEETLKLTELPLPTKEQFERRRQKATEYELVRERLWGDSGLDPEVEAFLRAAHAPLGAPLALLTPVVIAWLKERELSRRYSVRPTPAR